MFVYLLKCLKFKHDSDRVKIKSATKISLDYWIDIDIYIYIRERFFKN